MDLDNLVELVVHYLLIGRMACLGYLDEFPMVSALVYMMHIRQYLWWIMMQAYQLSWCTKLLYYMDIQPWENIMGKTLKWLYIPMDWVIIDEGW